ncbi:MAG: hypothetical protein U0974_15985 [Gemmatimonadales bacterium]|nr:hypothetical protein [Gemmatimonadales bacterium]MDZ4391224.1 hypothetical protein [Gemmatimonadales bacterium]
MDSLSSRAASAETFTACSDESSVTMRGAVLREVLRGIKPGIGWIAGKFMAGFGAVNKPDVGASFSPGNSW